MTEQNLEYINKIYDYLSLDNSKCKNHTGYNKIVDRKTLASLIKDSAILYALRSWGVKDWKYFDSALKDHKDQLEKIFNKSDEDITKHYWNQEYEIIEWPDIQFYMNLDGFKENSSLLTPNEELGIGSSTYLVSTKWLCSNT